MRRVEISEMIVDNLVKKLDRLETENEQLRKCLKAQGELLKSSSDDIQEVLKVEEEFAIENENLRKELKQISIKLIHAKVGLEYFSGFKREEYINRAIADIDEALDLLTKED